MDSVLCVGKWIDEIARVRHRDQRMIKHENTNQTEKQYPMEGSPKMARACAASSSKMHRHANMSAGVGDGGRDEDDNERSDTGRGCCG